MISALALLTHLFFSKSRQDSLRQRVLEDSPPPSSSSSQSWRQRLTERRNYDRAANYTIGDITMLRKELLAGFLVAGFITVHVPTSWWSHLFFSGHGWLTVVENVVVAPLLAVVSFVCSVGNIPLAAALWFHGVAFGGVISFIFADLITLPLLLIYRRFYGRSPATRLFFLLWLVMSSGGLLIDLLFSAVHLLAHNRHTEAMSGQFSLGITLYLNIAAALLLLFLWLASRRGENTARDPICGMTVDISAPVATRHHDGHQYYFCSQRCAEKFDSQILTDAPGETSTFDRVDPVCSMTVDSRTALSAAGPDATTYYFCGEGCRTAFLASPRHTAATKRGSPP
jgi:YHS domain-containing protein